MGRLEVKSKNEKKGENPNNMLEPSTDEKLKLNKLICEKGIKLFSKGLSVYLGY